MGFEFRDYCDRYEDAVRAIIDREWITGFYKGDLREASSFLVRFWSQSQDLRRVVLSDGRVIGVVFATSEPSPERIPYDGPDLPQYVPFVRDLETMDSADIVMVASQGLSGYGRLDLMMLSPEAKGTGIGRRMFAEASGYLQVKGCRGMYWVTDTDCNVGFYDHMGAERVAERDLRLTEGTLTRYVYRLKFRQRERPVKEEGRARPRVRDTLL